LTSHLDTHATTNLPEFPPRAWLLDMVGTAPPQRRGPAPAPDTARAPLWRWLIPVVALLPIVVVTDLALGSRPVVPELLSTGLVMFAGAHLAAAAAVPVVRRWTTATAHVVVGVLVLAAGLLGARWSGASLVAAAWWTPILCATVLVGMVVRRWQSPAVQVMGTYAALVAVASVWGAWFLLELRLSAVSTTLLWAAALFTAACVPSSLVQTYEAWETSFRRRWRRPRHAVPAPPGWNPSVEIHVPVHAEPPDVVIETLDRLAALDYTDFSVVVIDNNTEDQGLWQPVREHCARLGSRFTFLHLMGVRGAKAGALNEALRRTPASVELIAVVDADYQVRPDWLRSTVGHLADPRIAFVQCPHAYRNFHTSRFGRMAEAEYRVFFETSMVAYNERDAALTVGTMSLVRRRALDEVGGWAEWCLTEDSELSVRLHAAGHSSVYLTEPMGRGLIPETFAAYRRQRFRWTYGPVQELRAHAPLFRPGAHHRMSIGQLVHHGNHGLDVALIGVRAAIVPLTAAAGLSLAVQHEVVAVPFSLWLAATAMVAASVLMRWVVLRSVLGPGIRRLLGSILAFLSLTYVIQSASLRASSGLPAAWQRTDKFTARSHWTQALASARREIVAGGAAISCAAIGLAVLPERGLALMLLLGVAVVGAAYLSSAAVALIADADLRRAARGRRHTGPSGPLGPSSQPELVAKHVR
jgi:cellulose synthase/poly-beta-1,6-N-acetylglucosamine synthase-like glycosyltransferase